MARHALQCGFEGLNGLRPQARQEQALPTLGEGGSFPLGLAPLGIVLLVVQPRVLPLPPRLLHREGHSIPHRAASLAAGLFRVANPHGLIYRFVRTDRLKLGEDDRVESRAEGNARPEHGHHRDRLDDEDHRRENRNSR